MDSFGSMIVKALVAEEAFPVEDAVVRISGSDVQNTDVKFTLFTDEDGVTQSVTLPTSDKSNSETPDGGIPCYNYDVIVSKDGYYTKVIRNVSVFPGILSVLTVNMIPYISYADGGRYPRENLVGEE